MEVQIDLVADWAVYLVKRLDAIGGQLRTLPPTPADIGKAFFNAAVRRIPARPRRTQMPTPAIQAPADLDLAKGYRELMATSEVGGDLLPFQSTGILAHDGKDLMLFDWGIYHLHLSADPHPKKTGFNARTGPLLYVFVTDTDLYQIAIRPHGEWSCVELLDIVERNWPHLLDHARINMAVTNAVSTDEEIELMRGAQINCAVRLSSGNAYSFIATGIAMSGEAFEANRAMVGAHRFLKAVEQVVKKRSQTLELELSNGGRVVPETAVIRLVVDAHSVKLVEETSGLVLGNFSAQEQASLFGGPISSRARNL